MQSRHGLMWFFQGRPEQSQWDVNNMIFLCHSKEQMEVPQLVSTRYSSSLVDICQSVVAVEPIRTAPSKLQQTQQPVQRLL